MRTILITLILVGLVEGISGASIKAENNKAELSSEIENFDSILIEPRFLELGNNLFLALETGQSLELHEGAVIEFKFRKKSLKSFHVNDANQDVLNQGNADLIVMVHKDLALALKSEKLVSIKIIDGDKISSVKIDDYWQPHHYLSQL